MTGGGGQIKRLTPHAPVKSFLALSAFSPESFRCVQWLCLHPPHKDNGEQGQRMLAQWLRVVLTRFVLFVPQELADIIKKMGDVDKDFR